ncbi:related to ABC transporter [Fusarium fujikuroi IMI 58289]|uniref:Related to ABC transporter n=1 Tax=Gibberella fujikuroi (strain CBS 195.34 / IMI 58289 / NRRL A-6831) TaxID=1279085 RepID=S0DS70_GIBF5|nr:related to ABC transporter [Fusarium fujikuroi IMI 58289]KLP21027.1 ABC transporter [Fusarium fujikuroi]CCT65409.1 related to ABC transporter [Fusarium fujikuroi IMI 58289]
MFSSTRLWFRQLQALTRKIFLIALVKHWLSTLLRALLIPVLILVLVLQIQNFTGDGSRYGVGEPSPIPSLAETLPSETKLVFVQGSNAGSDVGGVITKIKDGLKGTVEVADSEADLRKRCPTSLSGVTNCYAAVIFNDSPLSKAGNKTWSYTIRVSSARASTKFDITTPSKNHYAPLQLAVENAITNSTTTPNNYMFTRITQDQAAEIKRRNFAATMVGGFGIVCFLSMISSVFHIIGMISTEREAGMAQLIDVMTGGAASARVLSYLIAFNIIYLPSWIIFGALYAALLVPTSNAGIIILWQILSGLSLTSMSVFAATINIRYTAISMVIVLMLLATLCEILDSKPENVPALIVLILSAIFPSSNYIFFLNQLCRNEAQGLATNISKPAPHQPRIYEVTVSMLWGLLLFTIVFYPLLAIVIEKWSHGVSNKGRKFASANTTDNPTALEIVDLTKTYKPSLWRRCCRRARPTIAVNSLSFSMQRKQVLCLLGINGSGKTTTLGLIAGTQKLTSGSINVNAPRSNLGICPQRNIHWPELSVLEHGRLWAMMKGGATDPQSLDTLVESCDLSLKKHSPVGTLSGGQMRKVQMLCMLAGGSSICLMDEVTTGMDPVSRRAMWNIILAERQKRSLILTTHFLDECEVLADQVVIVSHGHVKCQGSTAALKNLHGGGYRVHLPGVQNPPDTPYATTVHQGQTVFNTPDSTSAAALLTSLQAAGYSDTSLSGPTMEDVFLKVADEGDDDDVGTSDRSPFLEGNETPDSQLSSGTQASFLQQLSALLVKRLLVLKRGFWWYILAFAIPLIFTPVFSAMANDPTPFQPTPCVSTDSSILDEPWPIALRPNGYYDLAGSDNITMLVGPNTLNKTLFRSLSKYPIGKEYDMKAYQEQFKFQDDYDAFLKQIRDKPRQLVPGALYMDGKDKDTLAYNAEHGADGSMLMLNMWSQLKSETPISLSFAYFSSSIPSDPGPGMFLAILLTVLHVLYPAFFALYPAYERLRKIRTLQYSNSIQPLALWTSHIIVDIVFVILISCLSTLFISLIILKWYGAWHLFPVMLLYGFAMMLWCYIISLFARSELASFGISFCVSLLMFGISVAGLMIASVNQNPGNRSSSMDTAVFILGLIFPVANLFRAMVVGLNVWAAGCRGDAVISYPGNIHAYGGPVLLLCIQVAYLFALLLLLDGRTWTFRTLWAEHVVPLYQRRRISGKDAHIEMAPMTKSRGMSGNLVDVDQIYKSFCGNVAVDGVSLTMAKGELLALLGPNGAGKTTTINMMRGEVRPDYGNIYIKGVDMQKDTRAGRQSIGYCPQFDALDQITVRQQLAFYARVKGIADVQRNVNLVMSKVGLRPHADKLTSRLSGGNKRKLSLAIALLGNPPILILDEPSSAMDPIAKRDMWAMLSGISSSRSVLLTTHSMEEADMLATRVAILSKRILAAGTIQELRNRHSNSYEVHLVLESAPSSDQMEMQKVEAWIRKTFPGANFRGLSLGGQFRFSIPANSTADEAFAASQNRKGQVVEVIETLEHHKKSMGVVHYTVSMGTLEMIFLKIIEDYILY